MADDSTVSQRLKHGFESKILVPAAAGLVTIGVKYLVKKLPLILEEKLLPKLLEKNAPAQVTKAVEDTATALGGSGDAGASRAEDIAEQHEPARAATSNTDREEARREREQRRRQRKRALEKAA